MRLGRTFTVAFSSLLVGASLSLCPPASGSPTFGEVCNDWMKIARDSTTGQELVCGPTSSPGQGFPEVWTPPSSWGMSVSQYSVAAWDT
jgi:hypothetical protein